jgi:hypothetical protein
MMGFKLEGFKIKVMKMTDDDGADNKNKSWKLNPCRYNQIPQAFYLTRI